MSVNRTISSNKYLRVTRKQQQQNKKLRLKNETETFI